MRRSPIRGARKPEKTPGLMGTKLNIACFLKKWRIVDAIAIREKELPMNDAVPTLIGTLSLKDDTARFSAFQALLKLTETPVDWFGRHREDLAKKLTDENSYQRSIGAMLLCNLAKSAKSGEFDEILDAMMPLADDEKFITQRQYLQNIWKVAVADCAYRDRIVAQMAKEFAESAARKHCNLLRLDILSTMIRIMRHEDAEDLRNAIGAMIDSETDEKSRKKYLKLLDEGRLTAEAR